MTDVRREGAGDGERWPTVGKRRHATILFADICGSTRLGELCEPETLAEIVRGVKAAVQDSVSRFGGVVVQFQGDGVLAMFGYPETREDSTRRAIAASLEIHKRVRERFASSAFDAPAPVRLHSGVHSGLVLISEGDFAQGRYELFGDVVNTAAGLCAAAEIDEILVSAETLKGAAAFFTSEPRPPLSIKGKRAATEVRRVVGLSGVRTRLDARATGGLTPFVGRAAELERLHQRRLIAQDGAVAGVILIGDPGVGKTRLAAEFIRGWGAGEANLLSGWCESYGECPPLQPFRQMLAQLFGLAPDDRAADEAIGAGLAALDPALAALEPIIRGVLNDGEAQSGPQAPPAEIAGAIVDVLVARALRPPTGSEKGPPSEPAPLTLRIDDWQWADDVSRLTLAALLGAGRRAPILTILTAREAELGDPALGLAETVRLEPFSAEDTAAAIGALLGRPARGEVLEKVFERSGGNALFIEEICDAIDAFAPEQETMTDVVALPATLHELIESRVERLPAATADLIRTAAVIGDVVPLALLEEIAGPDVPRAEIAALAEIGLMRLGAGGAELRFKHGVTRETIYRTVRLDRRRAHHLAVAEAFERTMAGGSGRERSERLAHHYAGAGRYDEAARYAESAGDRAMAASSLDRARRYYAAALDALDRLEPTEARRRLWVSIADRFALPCVFGPSRRHLPVLARAVDYASGLGDERAVARLQFWTGYIGHVLGAQTSAIAALESALAGARAIGDAKLEAQISANLGQSYGAACEYDTALALLDGAISSKARTSSSKRRAPPVGFAYALACKAVITADRGDFDAALAQSTEALESVTGFAHQIESSILNMRGAVLLWRGEWGRALDAATRSHRISERVGAPYTFAMAAAIGGFARWKRDRDAGAIAELRQAADWLEGKEMRLFLSFVHGWLAEALIEAGEPADARRFALKGLDRLEEMDRCGEAMCRRSLALLAASGRAGAPSEAEAHLDGARRAAEARRSPHEHAANLLCEAEILVMRERLSEAEPVRARARRTFRRLGMTSHLAAEARLGAGPGRISAA